MRRNLVAYKDGCIATVRIGIDPVTCEVTYDAGDLTQVLIDRINNLRTNFRDSLEFKSLPTVLIEEFKAWLGDPKNAPFTGRKIMLYRENQNSPGVTQLLQYEHLIIEKVSLDQLEDIDKWFKRNRPQIRKRDRAIFVSKGIMLPCMNEGGRHVVPLQRLLSTHAIPVKGVRGYLRNRYNYIHLSDLTFPVHNVKSLLDNSIFEPEIRG